VPQDAVQDRQEECFGLPGAGPGGQHKGSPGLAGEERLLLVQIERRLPKWPVGAQEIRSAGAALDQRLERSAAHEVPRQRDVRTSHDHIGLGQVGLELLAEVGVEKSIGGAEKATVLGDEVSDGKRNVGLHTESSDEPACQFGGW
jgi:hypothetical protein